MKHFLSLIICAALALFLCACGTPAAAESLPETAAAPMQSAAGTDPEAPALDAFRAVLTGQLAFTGASDGGALRVNGSRIPCPDFPTELNKLALQDLDGDGVKELILQMDAIDTRDFYGYWILRYLDGAVLGYNLTFHQFDDLRADGTFYRNEGWFDGIATLRFTDEGWVMDHSILSQRTCDDNGDIVSQAHFLNGAEITAEALSDAYTRQFEKPRARWYSCSPENFDRAVRAVDPTDAADILTGSAAFYSRSHHMRLTPDDLCRRLAAETGKTAAIRQAALVDLDQDGVTEAVLQVTLNGNPECLVILHAEDGFVQGQLERGRNLKHIKADGAIHWTGGTFTRDSVERMVFDPSYWTQDCLLRMEVNSDGTFYFADDRAVSQEEYDAVMAEHEAQPDVRWVDFPG